MEIDEQMVICTHVYPKPLEQFFQTNHDFVLNAPEDRVNQQVYYYRGQLYHSPRGARKSGYNDFANSIIEKCYSIDYFINSIYNVEFLSKHFTDIIYRFCSSSWGRKIKLQQLEKDDRDELIHAGIEYYIFHVRYQTDGQQLEDCCDMKSVKLFAKELEYLISNLLDGGE